MLITALITALSTVLVMALVTALCGQADSGSGDEWSVKLIPRGPHLRTRPPAPPDPAASAAAAAAAGAAASAATADGRMSGTLAAGTAADILTHCHRPRLVLAV